MKRFLTLFLIAMILSNLPQKASAAFTAPDFAYPATVTDSARSALGRAASLPPDSASVVRLRALLEIAVASAAIDPDSAYAIPALIAAERAKPNNSGAGRAMLAALEASVLTRIYSSDSWRFDRVDVPAGEAPADIRLWGKANFVEATTALTDSAMAEAARTDAPLTAFGGVVTGSPAALAYLPTAADFIRSTAVSMARTFDLTDRADSLLAQGLELSAADSPSHIYWLYMRDRGNPRALLASYRANSNLEAARLLLMGVLQEGSVDYEAPADVPEEVRQDNEDAARLALVRDIEESLEQFPSWVNNGTLRNCYAELTAPRLTVKAPNFAAPESEVTLKLRFWYTDSAAVRIYRLPADGAEFNGRIGSLGQPMAKLAVRPERVYGAAELRHAFGEPGRYVLVPQLNDTTDNSYTELTVSPFLPVNFNSGNSSAVATVDLTTGAPVKGVTVDLKVSDFRTGQTTTSRLGRTDRHGLVRYDTPSTRRSSRWLSFSKDGQSFDFNQAISPWYVRERTNEAEPRITFITDRALYHQGDTLRFAAIVTNQRGASGSVAADTGVRVALFDANGQKVEELTLTTDALGRVDGSFAIPRGLLTGSYGLLGYVGDRQAGAQQLTVSDFKLPVIFVENTAVERDAPATGAVTLRGIVKTYSGMPVGGARVDVRVNRAFRWWWWFRPQEEVGSVSGTTAPDGTYTIEIPAEMLAATGMAGGSANDFIASITASDANADTAEASCNFSTGKQLALNARNLGNTDGARPASMTISAINPQGENQDIAILWELGTASAGGDSLASTALRGHSMAGSPIALDLGSVPAGVYALRVTPADTTLADPLFIGGFATVYNTATDAVPATGAPFFLPAPDCARTGRKASLQIGTALDEATVFISVALPGNLVSVKPYRLRRGFSTLEIEVPEETAEAAPAIMVVAVREGRCYSDRVTVKEPDLPVMVIETESFRDRLSPGSSETWRFRLAYSQDGVTTGPIAGAAMVATMFNGALNALQGYSMPSGFGLRKPFTSIGVDSPYYRMNSAYLTITRPALFDTDAWEWPQWMFLNQMRSLNKVFYSTAPIQIRGSKMNGVMMDADMTTAESAEDEELAMDVATPMASGATEDSADAEEEGGQEAATTPDEVQYRDGEVLQAFFMPRLVSDVRGNVDIVFSVPDANGTWDFRAFAWTSSLESATCGATAVASKPVMVQPNLPRFLRQGDTAVLGATVYNNSDSAAAVNSVVELFNISTGEVLESFAFADTIGAGASAIVSVTATAPTDRAAIGYRVRSGNGVYTDGEQTAIPVLSSESLVIESTEFYLNASQDPEVLDIPVHEGTSYTLEYVSNPIWTVVKAMRGLDGVQGTSAPALASGLFSALAARKIAADNAGLAEAFASWMANPQEHALESMLQRNEQLKMLLLNQTPWVQASQDQTARMAELARIFDSSAVAAALAAREESLERLQGHDGGFAWLGSMNQSSEWATRSVLMSLGMANSMDMLGSDTGLEEMCRRAFAFLCTELTRPERRTTTDSEFARICSLWPQFEPTPEARAILEATIARMASGWRSMSLPAKASAVYILKQAGRDSEASAILRSIGQFGVTRDGQGLSFPSVNDFRTYASLIRAFAVMDAPTSTIDAMRQWVAIRAQATDDLGTANPDYIIASVMLTGTDWTAAPRSFGVRVGGQPLEISDAEAATGYTVARLEPSGSSLRVELVPNGATPSYGAVIAIGNRPQASVAARPGRDIAIAKRFLVNRDGQWVATDTFALGERVRVQLILQVGRAMEYVAITDRRAATLAPVDQLPGYVRDGNLALYRENGDSDTRLFVSYLPAGTYHVTYDMTANNAGRFISGIATVQSQYAPELTAHSSGCYIIVE